MIRADLSEAQGLSTSKAGQAFINAFAAAPPELARAYLADGEGTQIAMLAPDEPTLRDALDRAGAVGVPVARVDIAGELVAIGIGPITRAAARPLTKRFRMLQ